MSQSKKSHSAGGVVLNPKNEVLVVNQNRDSWSLPKGHVDPGETALQAACREIEEESGVSKIDFVRELGTYERCKIGLDGKDDPSELKVLTFFLFRTAQTRLKPIDPRNPEARWVKIADVAKLLTHPKDREFFTSAMKDFKA